MVLAPVLAVVMFAGGVFFGAHRRPRRPDGARRDRRARGGPAAELTWSRRHGTTIQDNYVDPKGLDDQELAYGAIRGMTEAVGDEGHTSFMTAEEAKASDESLSGSFVGIGVQVARTTRATS